MMDSVQMWGWLAAVMIPAAVLSGLRLWVLEHRDRVQRARLGGFRGPGHAAGKRSKWEDFGRRFSPLVGADQERLLKLLAGAGFKRHGSLASFIAAKAIAAIVLVVLTWLSLEWRHLFSSSLQIGR